jgi:hypothetical protein
MSFSEQAADIQIDNGGNVVVAGWASTSGQLSAKDYTVVKYTSTGALLWQRHFNGPSNGEDQINDIDIDGDGNIYATGMMVVANGITSGTVKLSSFGDSLWVSYGMGSNSPNVVGTEGRFLKHLERENKVVVGGADGDNIRISVHRGSDGTREHSTSYGNNGDEDIIGWFRVEQTAEGGTQIAMNATEVAPSPDILDSVMLRSRIHTVKYALTITGVEDRSDGIPKSFSLHQNYPNPFNPTTVMSYELGVKSEVRLVVYDLLGGEVRTLVNDVKDVGEYSVTFDAGGLANGVYMYRLVAGGLSQARKMVLIK